MFWVFQTSSISLVAEKPTFVTVRLLSAETRGTRTGFEWKKKNPPSYHWYVFTCSAFDPPPEGAVRSYRERTELLIYQEIRDSFIVTHRFKSVDLSELLVSHFTWEIIIPAIGKCCYSLFDSGIIILWHMLRSLSKKHISTDRLFFWSDAHEGARCCFLWCKWARCDLCTSFQDCRSLSTGTVISGGWWRATVVFLWRYHLVFHAKQFPVCQAGRN